MDQFKYLFDQILLVCVFMLLINYCVDLESEYINYLFVNYFFVVIVMECYY